MDKESLKVILENLVESMNTTSANVFTVEGPVIRKRKESYDAKITLYINPINDDMKKVPKEALKLLELNYTFDFSKAIDEEVFQAIGLSMIEAKNKIYNMLMQTFAESGIYPMSKDITPQQKEYIA